MTLIEQIRAAYPEPRVAPVTAQAILDQSCHPETPRGYCVAGAVCLFSGQANSFPTPGALKRACLGLNPALAQRDGQSLYNACEAVVLSNDGGDFAAAWDEVRQLLEWTP